LLRAARRHPSVIVGVFILPMALGIGAALFVTPLYTASEVLVTAGDAPSGVWEAVKGRENLVKLAQRTHLADKVSYSEPLTEEGKLQLAVRALEYRLNIRPLDGNAIAIIADWTDGQTAYDLAHGAVLDFLETREGYRTLKPAEVPQKPKYPVRTILVVGGALLGLLMSIGISAVLDLASRR